MKKQLIVIWILLFTIFIPGCYEKNDNKEMDGITCLEKFSDAYNLINNSTNIIIISGLGSNKHLENGFYSEVQYVFYDLTFNESRNIYFYNSFSVTYQYDKKKPEIKYMILKDIDLYSLNSSTFYRKAKNNERIGGIYLDSNDAYKKAINNEEVKNEIQKGKKYNNLELWDTGYDPFTLIWSFRWSYDSDPSESGWSQIYAEVDGRTGEVLEVDGPGND